MRESSDRALMIFSRADAIFMCMSMVRLRSVNFGKAEMADLRWLAFEVTPLKVEKL